MTQLLNGLLRASSGSIYVDGQDIYDEGYDIKALRSKVGLVFQYPDHQLFETTCLEDVCFGPKNQGLDRRDVELRAFEALRNVGFPEELFYQPPFDLSGGQKRRVAIAGVLAMKPDVLILDEPTAGLDPAGRDEILGLVSKMHRELGITILLVSHSMEDVAEYVDRIIVMNHGAVMFDALPKQVFAHYKELEAVGLAAPQVTYLVHELAERGLPVDTQATTAKEAAQTILSALREKNVISCLQSTGEIYVKRYYSGPVLSGRFCRTQTGPACKIICDNDIYYCAVYVPGHFGICDHNRYAYFYDQNFKSTVFVYRKRVKSHCGAAFDYGSV